MFSNLGRPEATLRHNDVDNKEVSEYFLLRISSIVYITLHDSFPSTSDTLLLVIEVYQKFVPFSSYRFNRWLG